MENLYPWYDGLNTEEAVWEAEHRIQVSYLASLERQVHCSNKNCGAPISHCTCDKFGISKEVREQYLSWV